MLSIQSALFLLYCNVFHVMFHLLYVYAAHIVKVHFLRVRSRFILGIIFRLNSDSPNSVCCTFFFSDVYMLCSIHGCEASLLHEQLDSANDATLL